MSDRGQFTTPPAAIPLVVGGAVGVLVLTIVVEEWLSRVAAADGGVATCGLCHANWRVWIAWLFVGAPLAVLIMSWLRSREWQIRAGGDFDD